MSLAILLKVNRCIQRFENVLPQIFGRGPPPESLCFVALPIDEPKSTEKLPMKMTELWNDGFLWAVPKHRKSLEKRMKQKYGHPKYHLKIMQPKTTLRICIQCGHDHEVGVLCPHCYKRVMSETKEMQQRIEEKIGLTPDDKSVVVLYDGERDKPMEFWEGKRIIEMDKPRPVWFSKNLLQKTTQQSAKTTEVKPTNLG